MRKYFTVFSLSFQNEFTYRLNFILWRFRNVLRILMTLFLWTAVFSSRDAALGYSRTQMISYVFLVLIIQTLVLAAPSNDNVGGEINNGDLSNYLVKPISYLNFWLSRDWASKFLNIIFAVIEFSLLRLVFRPQLQFSENMVHILLGIIVWVVGIFTYFFLTKMAVFVAFWYPENTWGIMFIVLVFMEILSGFIFPLDVLPTMAQSALQFTPFPYLIYYPVAILIGKFSIAHSLQFLLQSLIWLFITHFLAQKLWRLGLKVYSASGR